MSIQVVDATGASKYYETTGAGDATNPFQAVIPEYRLQHAVKFIEDTYSDTVDIWEKGKGLRKFGQNDTVGTSWETIAQFQGTTANETFVTTNIIDSIVSSSGSDTTQTITIEGHTVDGSGNLTFVTQDASLNGQTEVTLSTPLARCARMYVKNSGTFGTTPTALAGQVVVYDNTDGITSGVPDTDAAVKCLILAGETQSQKCATSISSVDYYMLTQFSAGIGQAGGSANRIDVRIEFRDVANGGAWRPTGRVISLRVNAIGRSITYDPCIIIPKNHDVRVRARVDSNTASVFAEIDGYLAIVT